MTPSALLAVAAGLSLAATPTEDPAKQDLARLQGTWKLVFVKRDATKVDCPEGTGSVLPGAIVHGLGDVLGRIPSLLP
jgi:hypothetical protein